MARMFAAHATEGRLSLPNMPPSAAWNPRRLQLLEERAVDTLAHDGHFDAKVWTVRELDAALALSLRQPAGLALWINEDLLDVVHARWELERTGETPGADGTALDVQVRAETPGLNIVTVTGEVDLSNVRQLETALRAPAVGRGHVVVDVSGVRYIDSTGLRALAQAYRTAHGQGRRLVLAGVSPAFDRLLRIVGWDSLLPVFPDAAAAAAAIRQGGPGSTR